MSLIRIYRKLTLNKFRFTLAKFKPLVYLNRNVIKLITPKYTYIRNHKIYLDKIDYLNLTKGEYESYETDLINKLVKKGDVVIDIGANLGYYTLELARLVGNDGLVYAIEPDKYMLKLLDKNISINKYSNVKVISKGTYSKKLTLSFTGYDSSTDSGIVDSSADSNSKASIEVDTLDNLVKGRVDLIKMDIGGSEGETFKGMNRILEDNPNIIIITEYYPKLLNKQSINAKKFYELIISKGMNIYSLDDINNKLVDVTNTPIYSSKFLDLILTKRVLDIKEL